MTTKKVRRYEELNALKGRIREQKASYRKIADNLGMGTATFSDKINGFYVFDASEIEKICDELDITAEQVSKFFFPRMFRNVAS